MPLECPALPVCDDCNVELPCSSEYICDTTDHFGDFISSYTESLGAECYVFLSLSAWGGCAAPVATVAVTNSNVLMELVCQCQEGATVILSAGTHPMKLVEMHIMAYLSIWPSYLVAHLISSQTSTSHVAIFCLFRRSVCAMESTIVALGAMRRLALLFQVSGQLVPSHVGTMQWHCQLW